MGPYIVFIIAYAILFLIVLGAKRYHDKNNNGL